MIFGIEWLIGLEGGINGCCGIELMMLMCLGGFVEIIRGWLFDVIGSVLLLIGGNCCGVILMVMVVLIGVCVVSVLGIDVLWLVGLIELGFFVGILKCFLGGVFCSWVSKVWYFLFCCVKLWCGLCLLSDECKIFL